MVGIFDPNIFDSGIFDLEGYSSANSTIVFTSSGNIVGEGNLIGTSLINFASTSAAISSGEMIASTIFSFYSTPELIAEGTVSSSINLVFSYSAKLEDVKDIISDGTIVIFSTAGNSLTTVPIYSNNIYGLSTLNKNKIYGESN